MSIQGKKGQCLIIQSRQGISQDIFCKENILWCIRPWDVLVDAM